MWRYRNSSAYNQLLIAHILISISMSKMIFMKYLPPVRPKLVPKSKMLRIYWNLAHLIYGIFQSQIWYQKLFLSNIYHLLGPNWSKNKKYSEFIEIWHIWYFKHANFDVNFFFIKYLPIARPQLVQKWKILRIYWD